MADNAEAPPPKKSKLESAMTSLSTIKSILADEYSQPVQLVDIYVGRIGNSRHISKLIPELSRTLPLPKLQHLKRVGRDGMIILAEVDVLEQLLKREGCVAAAGQGNNLVGENEVDANVGTGLAEYFKLKNVDEELVRSLCTDIAVMKVAQYQPKLKWQYENANSHWPCKFHPNKYWENLYANTMFDDKEKMYHIQMMSACLYLAQQFDENPAGICVNPKLKRIAAIGLGNSGKHPMLHCPMVLIDNVAVSQNGGVWHTSRSHCSLEGNDLILDGIEPDYMQKLKDQFLDIQFGAQPIKPVESLRMEEISPHEDNLAKYGPYLCTGYDIYLTHEPCIMCAMALTHSRVRRVFYHCGTPKGALGSLTKVHCAKGLNHHYEAFQIV